MPNQDYIFYMKPTKMKMPTRERLITWYLELFQLGKDHNVIYEYKKINDYARDNNWTSTESVPLICGDLWVTRIEEAVQSVKKTVEKLHGEILSLMKRLNAAKAQKSRTKRMQDMEARLDLKVKAFREANHQEKVWNLVKAPIRTFSAEYFVLQLSEYPSPPVDSFQTIERNWLNDRHIFVDFFWEYMLEFSDERRAQFSTYIMLYRIFAESKLCRRCGKESEVGVNVSLFI